MTVRELRHLLFEIENQDAEVKLANGPVEYPIVGAVEEEGKGNVYLFKGEMTGYVSPGMYIDDEEWEKEMGR